MQSYSKVSLLFVGKAIDSALVSAKSCTYDYCIRCSTFALINQMERISWTYLYLVASEIEHNKVSSQIARSRI